MGDAGGGAAAAALVDDALPTQSRSPHPTSCEGFGYVAGGERVVSA